MKTIFSTLAFVGLALAQKIQIAFPHPAENIRAGTSFNVQVVQRESLPTVRNIGVAVTLQHCDEYPCEDVTPGLGHVSFVGPYTPQYLSPHAFNFGPYENFTVDVPKTFPKGLAMISVPHTALIGENPFFFTDVANVPVYIY